MKILLEQKNVSQYYGWERSNTSLLGSLREHGCRRAAFEMEDVAASFMDNYGQTPLSLTIMKVREGAVRAP